jgi:hypothetical protein
MGGAIQGRPLNLSNIVSTFAGASPSADGAGELARFSGPSGITTDGTNFYIADATNYTIRKVVIATGEVSTVAGKARESGYQDGVGTAARFQVIRAITTDGTNLYVVDEDTIRKVVIQTGTVSTIAGKNGVKGSTDGIGEAASFNNSIPDYRNDITTDGTNLYIADAGNHVIRKIDLATHRVSTLAGSTGMSGNNDGTGTSAKFNSPQGITTDRQNLYISDTVNHTIRKIALDTNEVTTLAGSVGNSGSTAFNIYFTDTNARFSWPMGLTTDGEYLYVTNVGSHTISKVKIASKWAKRIAGIADGWAGVADGASASARFYNPRGIVLVGSNLYIADSGNDSIRKIDEAQSVVSTFAGRWPDAKYNHNGIGAAANFNSPHGATSDGVNIYATDHGNGTIVKINIATREVSTLAGKPNTLGEEKNGTGTEAIFGFPSGITTDGRNIFVADSLNKSIRKIVIETGEVTTLAGKKTASFSIVDGVGENARFGSLQGLTTDGTNIYTVDSERIRKIVIATGATTTIAGRQWDSEDGGIDGVGIQATFDRPRGITTDGANLYIADMGNAKIRKLEIKSGRVTTFAGSIDGSTGHTDGIGADARFSRPNGITSDGVNLYVIDTENMNVRKIELSTGMVSTLAGSLSAGSADGIGSNASFNFGYGISGITTDGYHLYLTDDFNEAIRKIE